MPIPKPNPGENDDAFIARCMANDTMVEEYPNNSQRAAVCYGALRDARSKTERNEDVKRPVRKT